MMAKCQLKSPTEAGSSLSAKFEKKNDLHISQDSYLSATTFPDFNEDTSAVEPERQTILIAKNTQEKQDEEMKKFTGLSVFNLRALPPLHH
mmetsp:Transcript_9097/g.12374  ORF Transcript_9097/g.12374 Transcript_9097/m.12374 type:complete len:91 (-) Transcript_9097:1102-1374(-)